MTETLRHKALQMKAKGNDPFSCCKRSWLFQVWDSRNIAGIMWGVLMGNRFNPAAETACQFRVKSCHNTEGLAILGNLDRKPSAVTNPLTRRKNQTSLRRGACYSTEFTLTSLIFWGQTGNLFGLKPAKLNPNDVQKSAGTGAGNFMV